MGRRAASRRATSAVTVMQVPLSAQGKLTVSASRSAWAGARGSLAISRPLPGPKRQDAAAWGEFVRRYGGLIYRWCRQRRLQDADAQDVTQTILLRVARQTAALLASR